MVFKCLIHVLALATKTRFRKCKKKCRKNGARAVCERLLAEMNESHQNHQESGFLTIYYDHDYS